ncbi:MAG: carbohydrate kinase, partial [Clostridia bacterium]|nr:carbohydrate kinase [Clostridia bacterium]
FTENTNVFSPAHKVRTVDTTGAGDGFIGSFLWKMNNLGISLDMLKTLDGDTLLECLEFANKFCAISVQKNGAISSYPTLEELYK